MTLKSLFTSFTAGTAAAAVAGAAAVGVTSIALGAGVATAEPVVVNAPLAPAPELAGPLTQTVNVLGSGGSFSGKQAYVQDLGRIGGLLKLWLAERPGQGARVNDVERLLGHTRDLQRRMLELMARV